MKKLSKILSIILAISLVMGLALTVSAAAAEETKTIKATEGVMNGTTSISWTGANFKLVNEKGTSSSAIRTSDTSHFRVYKYNKTTISALNGEKLAKIAITTTGGEYLTALQNSLGTPSGATVATSGNVVTITFAPAVESFVINASAGQWRLSSIKVTYATGECLHTYDNCADTSCNSCGTTRAAGTCEYVNEYDAACEKCGATRTVTLPAANSVLTYDVAEKLALAGVTNTVYKLTGEVTNIANTTYGNMTIKDASGKTFYIYGTYSADGEDRFDAMANKPVVGDTITVSGKLSTYEGDAQMKNGWILEIKAKEEDKSCTEHVYTNDYDATCNNCTEGDREVTLPAADSKLTYDVAEQIALVQGSGTTAGKYYLTGEITKIDNTTYGNMTIKDASGKTFYIYGLYSADGKTRFDAMEKKPVVGDTITVYGVLSQYNGTAQVKNGWMTEHVPAAGPAETADPSIIALAAMMLPVSGIGLGALCLKRKKEN